MILARFFVAGRPATQGNHRTSRSGYTYETSKGHAAWRKAVEAEAIIARQRISAPLSGPLRLDCIFFFRRPKRPKYSFPTLDYDKLARAVGDSLKTGKLIVDDSHISTAMIRKRWTLDDGRIGAQITLVDDDLGLVG